MKVVRTCTTVTWEAVKERQTLVALEAAHSSLADALSCDGVAGRVQCAERVTAARLTLTQVQTVPSLLHTHAYFQYTTRLLIIPVTIDLACRVVISLGRAARWAVFALSVSSDISALMTRHLLTINKEQSGNENEYLTTQPPFWGEITYRNTVYK